MQLAHDQEMMSRLRVKILRRGKSAVRHGRFTRRLEAAFTTMMGATARRVRLS
jgi:hypothetical protein